MAELLSPAGGWDSLVAAVQNGADAVYMAGTSFGMRSFAGNFTPEELKELYRQIFIPITENLEGSGGLL